MRLIIKDNLPFISVEIVYRGRTIRIDDVLVDTGSATTILSADQLGKIDIFPSPSDKLATIRGIGGSEVVYLRKMERIQINDMLVEDFEVEIGGMDYGFEINGIFGMDLLTKIGAVMNLQDLSMTISGSPLDQD